MNFEDYEKKYAKLYAQFAALIRQFIKEAVKKKEDLPKLQSSKHRGKAPKSLQTKLADRGVLNSANIEKEVKDLAGVRLIFYTNTDVDRFLSSGLIREIFEVHGEETRIHHPTVENEHRRYQGIHYTVSLFPKLAKLSKYKKFARFRCEIQIQSVLNNAWSEMEHAVGYKAPRSAGFGSKARREMDNRMQKIMDDYLIPAGFDFQKVQKDYEHCMWGKALYDQNPLEMLKKCTDNNQRYQLISDFFEYVIPYFDDIQGMFPSILDGIENAVRRARRTKPKAIETEFRNFDGKTSKDVTSAALKIIGDLRYLDVERNFKMLITLYQEECEPETQQLVLSVIEKLAEYHPEIWKQDGVGVQKVLADAIENFMAEDEKIFRSVILTVWRALLKPNMESASFFYDKMTIARYVLPAFDRLKAIRQRAINGLITLLDRSTTEKDKKEIILTLWEATQTPHETRSNDLLKLTLENTKQIIDLLAERIADLPYEILESVEDHLLYDYRRSKQIAEAGKDQFQCKRMAKSLVKSIIAFRDKMNVDIQYVRYKTLVGFNGVFLQQWSDENFDLIQVRNYRQREAQLFIDEITDSNENEWFILIKRCASTESDDFATFSIFGEFLINLSKEKPTFVLKFIEDEDSPIIGFLPVILTGLYQSGIADKYEKVVNGYIKRKVHLYSISRHCSRVGKPATETIKLVLTAAMDAGESLPAIEAAAFAVKNHDSQQMLLVNDIFVPAVKFLTKKKDAQWVQETGFMPEAKAFFESMSSANASLILDNLAFSQKIGSGEETILRHIAVNHLELVLTFFQRRLYDKTEEDASYEAIPFQFYNLAKELGKNIELLITTLRKWYRRDEYMFERAGVRFLRATCSVFTAELGKSLMKVIANGSNDDYDFALALLRNYCAEPATYEVIKELIHRLPTSSARLSEIDNCLRNTGVVFGQFGIVEAYRRKKDEMSQWLGDPRPKVKAYAEEHIHQLEQRIASELRSAEMDIEIRKRDYEKETVA